VCVCARVHTHTGTEYSLFMVLFPLFNSRDHEAYVVTDIALVRLVISLLASFHRRPDVGLLLVFAVLTKTELFVELKSFT